MTLKVCVALNERALSHLHLYLVYSLRQIIYCVKTPPGTDLRVMMNNLGPDVYSEWELFATQLNIEPGLVESIRKEHGNCKTRFLHVLKRWRQSPPRDYPFTLESAVAILREPMLGLHQLADNIGNRNNVIGS